MLLLKLATPLFLFPQPLAQQSPDADSNKPIGKGVVFQQCSDHRIRAQIVKDILRRTNQQTVMERVRPVLGPFLGPILLAFYPV